MKTPNCGSCERHSCLSLVWFSYKLEMLKKKLTNYVKLCAERLPAHLHGTGGALQPQAAVL